MSYIHIEELPRPLSEKVFWEEYQKYQAGDYYAKQTILAHNLRLILFAIKKIQTEVDTEELFGIGITALIKALDDFDPGMNIKFSTVATKYILTEIRNFIRDYNRKVKQLISLEIPISTDKHGNSLVLRESLEDSSSNVELEYEKREVKRIIRELVDALLDKKREIIILSFGFNDGQIYTQKEIATMLNISREWVNKTLSSTLKELKSDLEELDIIERRTIRKKLK